MLQRLKNFAITRRFVDTYIWAVIAVGLLHHADHALRYDHSGWPVRPDPHVTGAGLVTPFSYSLLIYPIVLSLFFIRSKAYRISMSLLTLALVLATHIFVEPPAHIYRTWAENSSPYGALAGHPNVLNIASPLLGVIAVTWMLLLAICLAVLPVLIWRERNHAQSMI